MSAPENEKKLGQKFLLHGTLSARKLTLAKVQKYYTFAFQAVLRAPSTS